MAATSGNIYFPGTLKNKWSPGSNYLSPYNIDNPQGSFSGQSYPFALCHTRQHAKMGIEDGTGNYRGGIFYGLTIGDFNDSTDPNNNYMNLFDSLEYGIYSTGNPTVYNSVFTNIYYLTGQTGTGTGISCQNTASNGLQVKEKGAGINKFYGCVNGIYSLTACRLL